jgi:SGNH hydrolase-like domain, acetyltransferase AlgX
MRGLSFLATFHENTLLSHHKPESHEIACQHKNITGTRQALRRVILPLLPGSSAESYTGRNALSPLMREVSIQVNSFSHTTQGALDMTKDQQSPGLDSTLPPVGPQSERTSDKLGAVVGFALVSCGLVFNEWVIAKIASPDGHIEVTSARAILWCIDALLFLIGAFIVRHPPYGRVVLLCIMPFLSLAACSFVIFAVLEVFPALIVPLKLDHVPYYWLKSRWLPDDELVYRNKPFSKFHMKLKGDQYRDYFGVDVEPKPYSAVFDEYGFRNGAMPQGGWDVVVLGDSFVEVGHDEADTFTSRLAVQSRMKVRNLGIGGHGPSQYVRVLKRYGLTPKPTFVLFCFFEGNDMKDIRNYLQWQDTKVHPYSILTGNFVQRYLMALRDVVYNPLLSILEGNAQSAPGNLITIKVGDSTIKSVVSYKNETRSPGELLQLREWDILKELLVEFKSIAEENNIVPIVLFLPTKAHIYAEYSTSESETNWMTIRDQQIAAKDHVVVALQALCREIGMELISLVSTFERAASQGEFLYYPFDSHWNSEGRQLAASVLAEALISRRQAATDSRQ